MFSTTLQASSLNSLAAAHSDVRSCFWFLSVCVFPQVLGVLQGDHIRTAAEAADYVTRVSAPRCLRAPQWLSACYCISSKRMLPPMLKNTSQLARESRVGSEVGNGPCPSAPPDAHVGSCIGRGPQIKFKGGTPLAGKLQERILEPMLFDPIRRGTLRKPLLVISITDGLPPPPPQTPIFSPLKFHQLLSPEPCSWDSNARPVAPGPPNLINIASTAVPAPCPPANSSALPSAADR